MCIIGGNAYFACYVHFLSVQLQSLRHVVQQEPYVLGVQLHACKAGHIGTSPADAPRALIGPWREQCIKDIGYRNQFRMGMDLTPTKAKIAATVEALMVLQRHGRG